MKRNRSGRYRLAARRAEEALQNYARRRIEMDEDLRRRLAAELHDEFGRDLTALGLNFTILSNSLSPESRAVGSWMTVRIMIADVHAMVRDGLKLILEAEDDLVVVGMAEDGRTA